MLTVSRQYVHSKLFVKRSAFSELMDDRLCYDNLIVEVHSMLCTMSCSYNIGRLIVNRRCVNSMFCFYVMMHVVSLLDT